MRSGKARSGDDTVERLSALYTRFADEEFAGRSPLYETISRGVAGSQQVLDFLATLPPDKWIPNLLLASVRHVCGLASGWPEFLEKLLLNVDEVRSVMLSHSTQANEPARCTTLLPVLAQLPQPLALIEVGASAGLCLLPDFYAYDYAGQVLRSQKAEKPPLFACVSNAATPVPTTLPQIVWRAGLDLNPLDAPDADQAEWLKTLVWPEQTYRLANLEAALKIAAAQKPRIERGDLRGDVLEHLCGEAPPDATLVIFHTVVLVYVPARSDREEFCERAMSLCDYWMANENPRLLPNISARAGVAAPSSRYMLSVNDSPVAWADPHGIVLEHQGPIMQVPARQGVLDRVSA